MKTRLILSLALVGALVSNALSADYSKASNEELIKLSGKVTPKDYPDYRIEIHKRIQEMKVKDARIFREKLKESRDNAFENMTHNEYQEYKRATCLEMRKRLDSMSESQAIENGLIGPKGYGPHRRIDCHNGGPRHWHHW